jgi:molybdopterin synthase catalytic subunit
MDLQTILAEMRRHPEFDKAGMLLCHIGVVRGYSRDGRPVKGLRVRVDHERLGQVLAEQSSRPGIIDIRVSIAEDRDLAVGEDIMALVVAGDVRENVISVLTDTLNLIKTVVTEKTHHFRDET